MKKKKIYKKKFDKEKARLKKIWNNGFSSGWSGRGLSVLDQVETFDENFKKKKE